MPGVVEHDDAADGQAGRGPRGRAGEPCCRRRGSPSGRSRGRSSWGGPGRRSSRPHPRPLFLSRERRSQSGPPARRARRRSRRAPSGRFMRWTIWGGAIWACSGSRHERHWPQPPPATSMRMRHRGHQARRCPTGAARTCADGTMTRSVVRRIVEAPTHRGRLGPASTVVSAPGCPAGYRGRAHVYCRRSASAAVDGIRRRQARRSAQGLLRQTERETLHGPYPASPDTAADLSASLHGTDGIVVGGLSAGLLAACSSQRRRRPSQPRPSRPRRPPGAGQPQHRDHRPCPGQARRGRQAAARRPLPPAWRRAR